MCVTGDNTRLWARFTIGLFVGGFVYVVCQNFKINCIVNSLFRTLFRHCGTNPACFNLESLEQRYHYVPYVIRLVYTVCLNSLHITVELNSK